MSGPVLSVRNLGMTFPGTRALRGVDFEVLPGEVHALVGHNGSGKSTLVKILAGQYQPDPGSEVEIGGQPLIWQSPADSERLGLRVVHQNLGLVHSLSVTENVAMGAGWDTSRAGRIKWRTENKLVGEQMARFGYDIDPRRPVGELPAATRSAVAIARALMAREGRPAAHLVLLDEVTATMPDAEIKRLLDLVRRLKAAGIAVLYVSHHLEEVVEIADRVTVLRDGQLVTCRAASDLTHQSLADLLVGGTEWREHQKFRGLDPAEIHPEVEDRRIEVRNLTGNTTKAISFDAAPGRIVGIAGITGSGRDELIQMVFGGLPREGEVTLGGVSVPVGNPRSSVRMGMTLVPADRLSSAVVPTQNVRENLTLSSLSGLRSFAMLNAGPERRGVKAWISRLVIRGATSEGSINTLSGGNQQKVILARCLAVKPRVLLLDEPTQGVDIGAIAEIHALIRETATDSAVVVSSSDSYELASLCTEVLVLHRGRIVGHLIGDEVTEENLDRLQLAPHSTVEALASTQTGEVA